MQAEVIDNLMVVLFRDHYFPGQFNEWTHPWDGLFLVHQWDAGK